MRMAGFVSVFVGWMFGALSLWASLGPAGAGEDVFAAMRVRRAVPPVPAPDLALQTVNGSSLRLSDFQGKVVVLEFFVTT